MTADPKSTRLPAYPAVPELHRKSLPDDFAQRATEPDLERETLSSPHLPIGIAAIKSAPNERDERIAEEVSNRLALSKTLESERIALNVRDGEVNLAGIVATPVARLEAEHIASSVRGVVAVRNQIRVEP